jgi:hypothetical protein
MYLKAKVVSSYQLPYNLKLMLKPKAPDCSYIVVLGRASVPPLNKAAAEDVMIETAREGSR